MFMLYCKITRKKRKNGKILILMESCLQIVIITIGLMVFLYFDGTNKIKNQ